MLNEMLKQKIQKLINSSKIFLFMKGTPDAPQCGFSAKVVELLRGLRAEFGYFDILSDEEIREAVRDFSNWPTYPQLYVKGKFIGGCDIVVELAESGELKNILAQ